MNMVRGMKATLAVVIFAAGMGIGIPTAAALGPTLCPPTIINTIVKGDVVVPPGATCFIDSSTITGNVFVQPGASIYLLGATINKNFVSQGAHDVFIGNCLAFGCAVPRGTVVKGNLNVTGTTGVHGNLAPNLICDATIGGANVVIQGNTAPFGIGADPDCMVGGGGNKITASLMIVGNTAPITLRKNQIGGILYCADNVPSPINGGGNTAAGGKSGQCSAF